MVGGGGRLVVEDQRNQIQTAVKEGSLRLAEARKKMFFPGITLKYSNSELRRS